MMNKILSRSRHSGSAPDRFLVKMKILCFTIFLAASNAEIEIWESEVGSDMKIGPTTDGYERVDLRCKADHMEVLVVTEEEFTGVLYTRGSYLKKKSPCYLDPIGGKNFIMNIPLNSCKTKNDSGLYTNVLVLQYDDDLIMPGDAAFKLECDFRNDKEVDVSASFKMSPAAVSSKIEIADADPGGKKIPEEMKIMISNHSETVTFIPNRIRLKEEL